jgi:hypothetical protein
VGTKQRHEFTVGENMAAICEYLVTKCNFKVDVKTSDMKQTALHTVLNEHMKPGEDQPCDVETLDGYVLETAKMLVKMGGSLEAKDDSKNTPINKFMEMVREERRRPLPPNSACAQDAFAIIKESVCMHRLLSNPPSVSLNAVFTVFTVFTGFPLARAVLQRNAGQRPVRKRES